MSSVQTSLLKFMRLKRTSEQTFLTAEQTFSKMRRLKPYLRSNMSQKRLNHTLIISGHKSRVDSLNLGQIALEFVSVHERSLFFGGKL